MQYTSKIFADTVREWQFHEMYLLFSIPFIGNFTSCCTRRCSVFATDANIIVLRIIVWIQWYPLTLNMPPFTTLVTFEHQLQHYHFINRENRDVLGREKSLANAQQT